MPLHVWDVLETIIPHLGNTIEGYTAFLVIGDMLNAPASSRFIIDTASTFKITLLFGASGTPMTTGSTARYLQKRTRLGV